MTIANPDGTLDVSPFSLTDLMALVDPSSQTGPRLSVAASGNASLSLTATVATPLLASSNIKSTTLTVNWATGGTPNLATIDPTSVFTQLAVLTDADVLSAFSSVATFLADAAGNSALTTALPLANQRLASLLRTGSDFTSQLAAVTTSPVSLDALAGALQSALGGAITVSVDGESLKFQLQYAPTPVNEKVGLNLNLAAANIAGLTNLVDIGGAASLAVDAGGNLKLDLGLDLTDPSNPQPFLYNDTQLVLSALASATNVNFDATLAGLVGVSVKGGSAYLALDAAHQQSPATFTLGLASTAARYYFNSVAGQTQLVATNITSNVNGAAGANLPVYTTVLGTSTNEGMVTMSVAPLFGSPVVTVPTGVQNLFANPGNNFAVLGDGLSSVFDNLQSSVVQTVFGRSLPLVGNQLAGSLNLLNDVWSDPLAQFSNLVDGAATIGDVVNYLNQAFGASGFTITHTPTSPTDFIGIELKGSDTANVSFATGLGALPLHLMAQGAVTATAAYDLKLEFGVDEKGFYLVGTKLANTLDLGLTASLTQGAITANLGILQFTATDQGSNLQGDVNVDLEANAGGTEVSLATAADIFKDDDPQFNGSANINILLDLGFNPAAPSFSTDFVVNWTFSKADVNATTGDFGMATAAFNDVSVNVGSFIHNLVGNFIQEADNVIEPVRPLIDFLTNPLPLLSSLGIDVNVLDLLGMGGDAPFFDTLGEVGNFIHDLATITSAGMWNLGSYQIAGDVQANQNVPLDDESLTQTPNQTATPAAVSTLNNDAHSVNGLSFPVLDNPSLLAGVLLGKNVDLVKFDLPPLTIGGSVSLPPIPVFPPLPIFAVFRADVSATFNFGFGFDTAGLSQLQRGADLFDLLQGFYIDDTQPQATLSADFTASAQIGANFGAFDLEAGVGAGIYATANFQLNDPSHTGKVRYSDIAGEPLRCVFNTSGSIGAEILAYARLSLDLGFFGSITVFSVTFDQQFPIVDFVGSSRVDLQACKLEYSIVSPK